MNNLLRSLLLTLFLSFTLPILLLVAVLTGLGILGYLPVVDTVSQFALSQLIQFLVIFGDGAMWPGLLIIAATCSLVAGFFDLFNFWLYQTVRNH
ncbi:MAG: hypothetical protein RLZZ568_1385 [Cyanobacteriota bacterium]|jgi:hypothetical protein